MPVAWQRASAIELPLDQRGDEPGPLTPRDTVPEEPHDPARQREPDLAGPLVLGTAARPTVHPSTHPARQGDTGRHVDCTSAATEWVAALNGLSCPCA